MFKAVARGPGWRAMGGAGAGEGVRFGGSFPLSSVADGIFVVCGLWW